MSGRGRNNDRRGSRTGTPGRGSGRSGGSGNNNSKVNRDKEILFTPYYSGKQQYMTYDTVREHIIQDIQKKFKYGSDMVKAIRDDAYTDPGQGKPARQIADLYDERNKRKDNVLLRIEQDGYDLEYTEDLRNYNARVYTYEENKHRAYALIFGYCNKTMQNRIEEISDFETRVRNDPLELLREIKMKMYDPARAKYEFVSLTKFITRILNTKQEQSLIISISRTA